MKVWMVKIQDNICQYDSQPIIEWSLWFGVAMPV